MRIGLISDIHSNLAAFRAVLSDMPKVDEIICVGDLVGYGAEPNEAVKLARSKGIRAVMGNHDYAAVTKDVRGMNDRAAAAALWTADVLTRENLDYLASLPTHLEFKAEGQRIYVVHGSPRDPLGEYVFPEFSNRDMAEVVKEVEADVIVLGHTHIPMKRVVLGKIILNPGGVGQPRDRDPRASYAVLELGKELKIRFQRVEYDVAAAAEKIKAAGLPEELATRLFFGW
ncbi:MAG: metallophosphoesterase family protein [Hadesarchaea archaeon]|nr:metallophosphoesterase family protein [Hadesarchaea archaeon]